MLRVEPGNFIVNINDRDQWKESVDVWNHKCEIKNLIADHAWRLVTPPPKVVQGLVPDDQMLPGIFPQSLLQRGLFGLEIKPSNNRD